MPGFDGSRPSGRGPMTGGGRGYFNPGASEGRMSELEAEKKPDE